jgi:hypothetical protein
VIERVEADGVVVIVGADAAEVGTAVRAAIARGERVGAFIGSADDPGFGAALDEMRAELSGGRPES